MSKKTDSHTNCIGAIMMDYRKRKSAGALIRLAAERTRRVSAQVAALAAVSVELADKIKP